MEDKTKEEIEVLQKRIVKLEKTVCEDKRVIEALRESQLQLMNILVSIGDLVMILDEEGRFTFYHALETSDLYLPPEEFIGKKCSEVMPLVLTSLVEEAIQKNKEGEVIECEYPLDFRGEIRWYSAKLSPMLVNDHYAGSVAVIRNITKHKVKE
ncbi:MAG: PAS domain-containing protein [Candidatus Saelkia tenebricola]|nr:PAS domain-containing protein [Candidatus Saelkia tenebricola]